MAEGIPPSSGYTELGELLRQAGRSALSDEQNAETDFAGFRLVRLIGVGGMGASVYLAESHDEPPVNAAIKVLPESFALDQHLARRFRREAKVMQKIDHPNIVKMIDFGTVETGQHFILMEYLEGGSLAETLSAEPKLNVEHAVNIIEGVSAGLAALHGERITHRDVKPGNILLDAEGVAKLADFGLAKFLDPTSAAGALTRTGDHLGTTAYMAPEQLAGTSSGDHGSDLYSLGVVFYQMLSGVVPHGSVSPPSVVRPELAPYDDVVMRAIDAEPSRRFSSVIDFQKSLSEAKSRKPRKRLSRRLAIGGIVGLAGATWIAWPPARPERLDWDDVSSAQRTLGNATEFEIGLPALETTMKFRIQLRASSYRVVPIDVPDAFLKSILPATILSCLGAPSLLGRLTVKVLTLAIPGAVRTDGVASRTLSNVPSAQASTADLVRFAETCRWLDRIDTAGIMRREDDGLSIDPTSCPDYGSFSAALGIGSLSVEDALAESAERDAMYRVGCYQILRQAGSNPHPAISADDDFRVEQLELRTPLEMIAALIAEPWLLPRLPSLPWRALYDGQFDAADTINEPTVVAVEKILENFS